MACGAGVGGGGAGAGRGGRDCGRGVSSVGVWTGDTAWPEIRVVSVSAAVDAVVVTFAVWRGVGAVGAADVVTDAVLGGDAVVGGGVVAVGASVGTAVEVCVVDVAGNAAALVIDVVTGTARVGVAVSATLVEAVTGCAVPVAKSSKLWPMRGIPSAPSGVAVPPSGAVVIHANTAP